MSETKTPYCEKFNKCPYCKGTDLQRNRTGFWFDDENQTVKIEVNCENCGGEFEEVYVFVRAVKV